MATALPSEAIDSAFSRNDIDVMRTGGMIQGVYGDVAARLMSPPVYDGPRGCLIMRHHCSDRQAGHLTFVKCNGASLMFLILYLAGFCS